MSVESEASPQARLDFLAHATRKALRHLDGMSPEELAAWLQAATSEAPPLWATVILKMHDELRPALTILGLDYHREGCASLTIWSVRLFR